MATNRPAAFQFGDLECCALRPGNVHSADGWKEVLDPVVQCYRGKVTRIYFRADAAFAMPEVYELRLQLHALAYNLANFLRTLATPEPMSDWSLTTLKEKLIKIGAKVVSHGRYSCSRWPRSQSHGR
jgi:Transposase DDE domain group 1